MIYLIIILAVCSRFVAHMPNFAPITALAIFSGAYLDKKQAIGITLAARFISDLFLGFFSWPLMVAVYLSHLAGIGFGLWIKNSKKFTVAKIGASSLGASAIFFLVTNFAFLYSNYPHNLLGIGQSYINALPFLKGTVLGDLTYTTALFGGYYLAQKVQKKALKTKDLQNFTVSI